MLHHSISEDVWIYTYVPGKADFILYWNERSIRAFVIRRWGDEQLKKRKRE